MGTYSLSQVRKQQKGNVGICTFSCRCHATEGGISSNEFDVIAESDDEAFRQAEMQCRMNCDDN